MDWTQLWGNDDDDDGSGPGDDDHNDYSGSYDEGWCQFLMMIKAGSKGSWLFFNSRPAHMHWSHPTCSPPQSVIIFTSIWSEAALPVKLKNARLWLIVDPPVEPCLPGSPPPVPDNRPILVLSTPQPPNQTPISHVSPCLPCCW